MKVILFNVNETLSYIKLRYLIIKRSFRLLINEKNERKK